MTVGAFFETEKLTRQLVHDATDISDYWFRAGTFVLEHWNRDVESLSPKQVAWLTSIQEDLTEKRIEGVV